MSGEDGASLTWCQRSRFGSSRVTHQRFRSTRKSSCTTFNIIHFVTNKLGYSYHLCRNTCPIYCRANSGTKQRCAFWHITETFFGVKHNEFISDVCRANFGGLLVLFSSVSHHFQDYIQRIILRISRIHIRIVTVLKNEQRHEEGTAQYTTLLRAVPSTW